MNSVVEIRPLTRVEGHGGVFVYMAGKHVERVRLSLTESPRLFEALLLNRSYQEIPEIICRICSLCSTVHRVTAVLAIENAFDISVSEQVALHRKLILIGGLIQSHALHLFCLVLPDHFHASGFAELASKEPELFKSGLRIKETGNRIQEALGGRLIHPVTIIPGGMGKPVSREGLLQIRKSLQMCLEEAERMFTLFASFPSPFVSLPRPNYLAVRTDGHSMTGQTLEDAEGNRVAVSGYGLLLREDVAEGSYAKRSLVRERPVTVGALSRLNLGMPLSRKASIAFQQCGEGLKGADIGANHIAQALELIHFTEQGISITDSLLACKSSLEKPPELTPRKKSGSAACEAPRGTLIHSYGFDGRGRCTAADIITPTSINQAAMEADLLFAARSLEGADETELKQQMEMLVRAYDPCISCAVHMVRTEPSI